MPRQSLTKPFDTEWNNDVLTLVAARDLNERSWAAWFGAIQSGLEKRQWNKRNINVCVLNLSYCRWADPLPLLSLALSLAVFEANGGEVRVVLPPSPHMRYDSPQDRIERERFLKFLSREGFLDLLVRKEPTTHLGAAPEETQKELRTAFLGEQKLSSEQITKLRCLSVSLAFEESTCVPATLLKCDSHQNPADIERILNDIDVWVLRTIQARIDPVVSDKVPAWAHRGILSRLQTLLRETLHNIVEHAYDKKGGLAGVYVRYREGRLGMPPSTWETIEKYIRREEDGNRVALMRSIPTYQSFPRTRAGFLEVFILDSGRGLIERLKQDEGLKQLIEGEKDPLHIAMLEVFSGRSTKKDRPTEKGGLYLLRLLLEPTKDYLRGRDADSWWGRELPLPMTQSKSTPAGQFSLSCGANRNGVLPVRGLTWTVRLSWLDRMDSVALPDMGKWQVINRDDRHPLLRILKESSIIPEMPAVLVCDWRLAGAAWQSASENGGKDPGILLVLPGRDWMKNQVQDRLIEATKDSSLDKINILVVGDIVSEEALTYVMAIRRAVRLSENISITPDQIILVTRDLRSLVFCLHESLYVEDEESTADFVKGNSPWSLTDYYRTLRNHDGRRFWSIVNGSKAGRPKTFLREWVDWHDGCYLNGYLDFPATLTNPVCREIYNIGLERLIALFPQRDCRLIPLDGLVESLIVRFRARQRPRCTITPHGRDSMVDIFIGSVWVTGSTENSRTQLTEDPTVFHFFSHPCHNSSDKQGGASKGFYLLPWLGPSREDTPDFTDNKTLSYRRIGRTPWIARGGWKAFRIPRFDKQGQSLYEATPHETYTTWQDPSRALLKIGHWSYGGHHDLLTVNLLLAFDTELDQVNLLVGGKLARFVYANLFRAFAIRRDHLNEEGERLWDRIEKDRFQRLIPCNSCQLTGILVYPSHPVSDHVVGRLTGWLKNQDKLNEVLERCVPILPLRRYRAGSGLQLSGLTLEHLKSFIAEGTEPPSVTYFDDALISGHTYQQVKSLLYGLGFQRVYSLAMLDRQRLPSAHHVDYEETTYDDGMPTYRNVCYWRLDAPSMGSQAHCPLCKGIGRVKDLARGVRSPERRQRALEWLNTWAERNPAIDWGDGGLRPIPLSLKKPNRKFCIEPDSNNPCTWKQAGDGKEVVLTNSAGLVAWATELHSITFRDDLPLKFLDSEVDELDPETRIQLCASQLLLFHGEFDYDLAITLSYHLARALFEAKAHDRNTALAAITLIACGDRMLEAALQRLKKELELRDVVRDNNTNLDFITLLELRNATKARGGLKPTPALLSNNSRLDIYRELQEITCIGIHDFHSSPFSRLHSISTPLNKHHIGYLEDAIRASLRLKTLLDTIKPSWFRYRGETTPLLENYESFRQEMAERLTELTTDIKQALEQLKSRTAPKLDVDVCKSLAKEIVFDGNRLALAVFAPLDFQALRNGSTPQIQHEVQKAVDIAYKGNRIIRVVDLSGFDPRQVARQLDGGKSEYYVVWDSLIQNALDYILSNVRHADPEPILCPWSPNNDDGEKATAHLWIRIDIQKEHFNILLQNRTRANAATIRDKTKGKQWIKTFEEIGGSVTYSSIKIYKADESLLETCIQIPYSFYLDNPTQLDDGE